MNKRQRMLNRLNAERLFDLAQPRRVGGGCLCARCGKQYYDHPNGGPPDNNGDQYLTRLCDGRLVKL